MNLSYSLKNENVKMVTMINDWGRNVRVWPFIYRHEQPTRDLECVSMLVYEGALHAEECAG